MGIHQRYFNQGLQKAEKHWKINTLRVEIASIKHRINVKYKELGRYTYESYKAETLAHASYQTGSEEIFQDLKKLEADIVEREMRIEVLEKEDAEAPGSVPLYTHDAEQLDDSFFDDPETQAQFAPKTAPPAAATSETQEEEPEDQPAVPPIPTSESHPTSENPPGVTT